MSGVTAPTAESEQRAGARWSVDLALTHRASVIYIKDVATSEAGGAGRVMSRRLGSHVRGIVFDALRHLAGVEGIAVVTVPGPRHVRWLSALRPVHHPPPSPPPRPRAGTPDSGT
jgi:hypothetical protein